MPADEPRRDLHADDGARAVLRQHLAERRRDREVAHDEIGQRARVHGALERAHAAAPLRAGDRVPRLLEPEARRAEDRARVRPIARLVVAAEVRAHDDLVREPDLHGAARIGRDEDLLAAERGVRADLREHAARAEEPAVHARAERGRHAADVAIERHVPRRVDGRRPPGVGVDVVAGRLAEDVEVAFARGDRERAEAGEVGLLAVDVEPERQRERVGEAVLLGRAQPADVLRRGEVRGHEAEAERVGAAIGAAPHRHAVVAIVALAAEGGLRPDEALLRVLVGLRGGIVGRERARERVERAEGPRRQHEARRELGASHDLRVGPARQRRVRRELLRILDDADRLIEPALAHRGRDDERADTRAALDAAVEDVGLRAPRWGDARIAEPDVDDAADGPAAVDAERGRREPDVADEVVAERGAIAAHVVERGDRHAVDEHARLARRRAPHDDVRRARARPRDGGQGLDDLRRVAAAGQDARERRVHVRRAGRARRRARDLDVLAGRLRRGVDLERDVDRLAGVHGDRAGQRREEVRRDDEVVAPGRQLEAERAVVVGRRELAAGADDRARHRRPRGAIEDPAAHDFGPRARRRGAHERDGRGPPHR